MLRTQIYLLSHWVRGYRSFVGKHFLLLHIISLWAVRGTENVKLFLKHPAVFPTETLFSRRNSADSAISRTRPSTKLIPRVHQLASRHFSRPVTLDQVTRVVEADCGTLLERNAVTTRTGHVQHKTFVFLTFFSFLRNRYLVRNRREPLFLTH